MSSQLIICLVIFVLTIIGYTSGKFKLGLVAIASLLLLSVTGCLTAKDALGYFSNSNVIMIAGMCIVGAGFQRTSFCTKLANGIAGIAKGKISVVMFGYTVIGVVLSQFIQSPVVVFGIVAPMLITTSASMGLSASKVVFPVGIATIITCCTLPLGAGATVAGELNGYIESYYAAKDMAVPYVVNILDPMIGRLPLMIIVVIYCSFFAIKLSPDKSPVQSQEVKAKGAKEALKPFQEISAIVIFFAVALGMMFADTLGLATWQVTVIGALLMGFFVMDSKEVLAAIPLDMLFLIVGALGMAGALGSTGAGELIGTWISKVVLLVGGNSYIVGLIFFVLPFILTQFMSNRGAMLIFHPIAIATCEVLDASPVGLMILIQAACLSAFMTPMATAAVPYIMGCGGYDQRSMIKQGAPLCLICAVVSVLWIMTMFPLFP